VIVTGVYSLVLFAGLSIALLALDRLFGRAHRAHGISPALGRDRIRGHHVVVPAWMPADLAALDGERSYPLGLKVFAQYLLVPIVIGYLVILTGLPRERC